MESIKEFEEWLEDQPREVAVVLAHRIAARVLPVIATDVMDGAFGTTWRADLTFSTIISTM